MGKNENNPIARVMRALHRDIGFFLVGLTIIYSLSGIVLIYRGTDFMKQEKKMERQLAPNLSDADLGRELRLREVKTDKTEGDILYFQGGSYNKSTGEAVVTVKELAFPFNKFTLLHKAGNNGAVHWFTTIFGLLLFFMAISSFWMFKPRSKSFRRGLILAGIGIVFSIILLMIK